MKINKVLPDIRLTQSFEALLIGVILYRKGLYYFILVYQTRWLNYIKKLIGSQQIKSHA